MFSSRSIGSWIAIIITAGCAKGGDASPQPPPADPYYGRWESTCTDGALTALSVTPAFGVSSRTQLDLKEDAAEETTFVSMADCSGRDIEMKLAGTHERLRGANSAQGPVDLRYTSYVVTPLTPIGAKVLSMQKYCGIEDWAVNGAREVNDVAAKNAGAKKKSCLPVRETRTVFSIENDGHLYYGRAPSTEQKADDRVGELRRDFSFTRSAEQP